MSRRRRERRRETEGWCGSPEAAAVTLLSGAIEVSEGGSVKRRDSGVLYPRDQQRAYREQQQMWGRREEEETSGEESE
jgi:hypothetical protein